MSSFYFYTIYYFYTSIRLILRSQCPPVKNGNNFVVRYNKMLLCYLHLSIYTYMFEMFIFWKLLLKALVNGTILCRLRLHLLTSSFLRVNFLFFPIQYHSQIFDETCFYNTSRVITTLWDIIPGILTNPTIAVDAIVFPKTFSTLFFSSVFIHSYAHCLFVPVVSLELRLNTSNKERTRTRG